MATEADLIQKFKDLNIPVGADFEELIHEAFTGANLVDKVENHDSRIATVENNLDATKGSIQSNTNQLATKADDSKVLHSTVTDLNSTDMNTVLTAGFYRLVSGTNGMPNVDNYAIYQVINLANSNGVQLAYGTNHTVLGMRSWNSWNSVIRFRNWIQLADDSKVAHLSGANNFDTVPTVNNNPLLLASSLSSTLADTTKLSNFTAGLQSNGTAVATISDVTTAVSAATANMADTTKATNFTNGLQSGGVDVATAADLKSIEASAWRELDKKYITSKYTLSPATSILYKIDDITHKLYLSGSIALTNDGYIWSNIPVTVQLGSIIKSVKTLAVSYLGYVDTNMNWKFVNPSQSGTDLTFLTVQGVACITATPSTGGSLAYVTYDELV